MWLPTAEYGAKEKSDLKMEAKLKDNTVKLEHLCFRAHEFPKQPMVSGHTHKNEFGSMHVMSEAENGRVYCPDQEQRR